MVSPERSERPNHDEFLTNRLPEPYKSMARGIPELVERLDTTFKELYPQIDDGRRRRALECVLLILRDAWPLAPDEQLALGAEVMFPASTAVIGLRAFDLDIREEVDRQLADIFGPCCDTHRGNWRRARKESQDRPTLGE